MPKEPRKRAAVYSSSARIAKRQFAVSDNAIENIAVGNAPDTSANDILHQMASEEAQPHLKKKERQQLKRELFLQRLESSQAPYSKSHARRLKRKAQQEIGRGLGEVEMALAELEQEIPVVIRESVQQASDEEENPLPKPKPSLRGLIGEGKSNPLSQTQRKKALQTERFRMPVIRKDPNFAANPFAAIRAHAQNTLVKHQPTA